MLNTIRKTINLFYASSTRKFYLQLEKHWFLDFLNNTKIFQQHENSISLKAQTFVFFPSSPNLPKKKLAIFHRGRDFSSRPRLHAWLRKKIEESFSPPSLFDYARDSMTMRHLRSHTAKFTFLKDSSLSLPMNNSRI